MRHVTASCTAGLLAFATLVPIGAQQPRTFEVASIRQNVSGDPRNGGATQTISTRPGGLFTATNATLESLIRWAHYPLFGRTIPVESILGGPSWVRQMRFDIQARAQEDVPREEMYPYVHALLEERFGLVVDKGVLERDVYALLPARSDGRLGPQMVRRAEGECRTRRESSPLGALRAALHAGPDGEKRTDVEPVDPATLKPVEPLPPVPPGAMRFSGCGTMSGLAQGLTQMLKTTVTDRTGLTGEFDYVLAYAGMQPVPGGGPDVPIIFVAIEEQLGLKLERQRGDVEVLVIDAVHELIEN